MNMFDGNLNRNYGEKLMGFHFNGRTFEIRCTEHSLERFKERNLDVNISCGDIVSLGKERLYGMSKSGDDVAIINTQKNLATIITFESEGNETQIRIRTIIGHSNIYVKDGTRIYRF